MYNDFPVWNKVLKLKKNLESWLFEKKLLYSETVST